jgi:LPS export ABC transporter protein LptC
MRVRWWAAVAVLALGLGAMLWSAGQNGRPTSPPEPRPTASPPPSAATPGPDRTTAPGGAALPPFTLDESSISAADAAGRVQWELRAQTVETSADQQEVRLVRAEAKFFEKGAVVLTLTAPAAVFSARTQDVTMTGGVRARAARGSTLQAGRVQWLAARRLLVATGGVRLRQERFTVRADSLESDIGLRRTKLRGNIRVTVEEER